MSDTSNDPPKPDAEDLVDTHSDGEAMAEGRSEAESDVADQEDARAEEPRGKDDGGKSTPPPRRGGRGLAFLALLLAFVALAAAGWPWWLAWQEEDDLSVLRAALERRVDELLDERLAELQREQRDVRERLEARLDARLEARDQDADEVADTMRRRLDRSERQVAALRDAVEDRDATLEQREAELERTVAGLRGAFAELAGDVARAAPPDSREWRIAEAGYLLRIANQRARLERDLRGAHALLTAADEVLAGIDDFSLVPVREALVEAKAKLAAQPSVDRIAVYLELEAVALAIEAIPLEPLEFAPPPEIAELAREAGWWAALERRLLALFDFRRHRDAPVRALRTPEASFWWHHNVRLKLSQAQLALLRGDQEVWEGTLTTVAEWVREHPGAEALAEEIEVLADRPVRVDAPDISEPLERLETLRMRVPTELNP